jgi:hypothetical protein
MNVTHLEWGLLMIAAALTLGGLASGPIWYSTGHRHGREDGSYGDGPKHRRGGPQVSTLLELPAAGRLPVQDGPAAGEPPAPQPAAGPPWMFFGGAQLEPQPGREEYELLTRKEPCEEPSCAEDETPSAFTQRMALDMDEFIRGIEERSNYWQHIMKG